MNLDLGSFAFNCSFEGGGGTPSWGTALGQGVGYKITRQGAENLILGMTHQFYPKDNVYCPLGKGGNSVCGKNTNEIQQVALFKDVYVNDTPIGYPFILLLQVEDENSKYHAGRLTLKYNKNICIQDGKGGVLYSNIDFITKVQSVFGISNKSCWFVYDIDVEAQEILRLSAVFVADNSRQYKSADERKEEWLKLIPVEKRSGFISTDSKGENTRQQIFYGAPGTGKSHKIEEFLTAQNVPEKNVFRMTFHPDSDYSTFVGAYKPTMRKTGEKNAMGKEKEEISYSFVPQSFLKAYVRAWMEFPKEIYLVIEEINRGNCAQIFGDLFQLLDRDSNGFSEYPIDPDDDIKRYIEGQNLMMNTCPEREAEMTRYALDHKLSVDVILDMVKSGEKLLLPSNLYIWATMNTSDQSLFPIDSAFKRRWDWEYEPIKYKNISWTIDIKGEKCSWVKFQKEINRRIFDATHSEDKMLGDYFVNPADGVISADLLRNKVLFYLWNDVCKDGEGDIFRTSETEEILFSDLYKDDGDKKLIDMMTYLKLIDPKVQQQDIKSTTENESENQSDQH